MQMSSQSMPFQNLWWAGTDLRLLGIGRSQWRTNRVTTIDTLPDNVLLDIFDLSRVSGPDFELDLELDLELDRNLVWNWHTLVHVCRRWRQVVFASPIRLDLHLLCTYGTPVRTHLGCWPAFPIIIDYDDEQSLIQDSDFEDDVIAALEHPSRVRHIKLTFTNPSFWGRLAPLMQKPFSKLTLFSINSAGRNVPILPSGFLGGSIPCLQEIRFHGMPTLALPTLLCSASNVVDLALFDLESSPTNGHISLAALVTGLAMLPRLDHLFIGFVPWSLHDWSLPVPPRAARVVLPALTSLDFEGETTLLEDFVSQIDAPMLTSIEITYIDIPASPIPELYGFLKRSDSIKSSLLRNSMIYFDGGDTIGVFFGPGAHPKEVPSITIHIKFCEGIHDQVSLMVQVLSQISAMLSNVVRLVIRAERLEDLDSICWLHLLYPFTAVKILRVSKEFAKMLAHALKDMPAETATQMLPALDFLLEGEHMTYEVDRKGPGCSLRPIIIAPVFPPPSCDMKGPFEFENDYIHRGSSN
jgi:hypothetical protein